MKPRFAKSPIIAGVGVLPAQHRTSDISQKAPRLKLDAVNPNLAYIYHTIHYLVSTLVA